MILIVIIYLLIMFSIFLNGSTDAVNSIATIVGSKTMSLKKATRLAAFFNVLGIITTALLSAEVTKSIINIVVLTEDFYLCLVAIGVSLFSIILYSGISWIFSIPSSESHALMSGLIGASVAINKSLRGINVEEVTKIIIGLFISIVLGFLLSVIFIKILVKIPRVKNGYLRNSQIIFASLSSFLHGAQDGQKFLAIFFLVNYLGNIQINFFYLTLLTALFLGIGTLNGGKKIVNHIGNDFVTLNPLSGTVSDLSSTITVLFLTIIGIPISTTHVKTSSILGLGIGSKEKINKTVLKELIINLLLTFPSCFVLSYFLADLFI